MVQLLARGGQRERQTEERRRREGETNEHRIEEQARKRKVGGALKKGKRLSCNCQKKVAIETEVR